METNYSYNGNLDSLFSILDNVCMTGAVPQTLHQEVKYFEINYSGSSLNCAEKHYAYYQSSNQQVNLFNEYSSFRTADSYSGYMDPYKKHFSARELFDLCEIAYKDIIYAWMSELPIEKEIIAFAWKIISAGRENWKTLNKGAEISISRKISAQKARTDRGDINVRKTLNAAAKTAKELNLFSGILRFDIKSSQIAIAKCSPDYFILPGLARHFSARFGKEAWAIIDEKRKISLFREKLQPAKLVDISSNPSFLEKLASRDNSEEKEWEALWKNYHSSLNNKSRENLQLQKRFMPKRYWKYLPEMQ